MAAIAKRGDVKSAKGVEAAGQIAPLRIFHGLADEETSPGLCATLVERSKAEGDDIEIALYPGATHDFDDPGAKRQSIEANAAAAAQATVEALQFFREHLD